MVMKCVKLYVHVDDSNLQSRKIQSFFGETSRQVPRGFVVTLSGSRSLIGPSVEGRGLERVTSSLGTFFFTVLSVFLPGFNR